MRPIAFLLVCAACAGAQTVVEEAYRALRDRDYTKAIAAFREALRAEPGRAAIRKDLAYTYLKTGETVEASDQFAEAMKLDPADTQAALEYAFLCYETRRRGEARRAFARLRAAPVAAQAFESIDRELREGIERWSEALRQAPRNYSAAVELARLAEDRDDLPLAIENYERALKLKPAERGLLIDLARVLRGAGEAARAETALRDAWRTGSPRVAEQAREMLPSLSDALPSAREMGFRSYDAGYLNDALKYLLAANEADPADAAVMIKLGWTYNVLRRDADAVQWFDKARRSADPAVADQAERAYRNLRPRRARLRTTAWFFPMFSSRWHDVFGYAQCKLEAPVKGLRVTPYATLRFIGDTRRASGRPVPEYLAQSAFLPGIGVAASPARGVTLWAEVAAMVGYRTGNQATAGLSPDYRGGAAIGRGKGALLGGEKHGAFVETANDIVFVSRFNNDVIAYSQNRFGYTLPAARGGLETQFCWNANLTQDVRREYWADFVEFGPGFRFRWKSWPPSLSVTAAALRGAYTRNEGNPRRPNFNDFRLGVWYAFTK